MQDRLYGWLKKKSSGGAWNKRYFFVDETRGTLGYAKSHKGRGAKPSAVLPIADITRIEAVRGSDIAAFTIVCPPIHLTVAAVNPKERKNWMRQLEMRGDLWKQRQREKMPVADVSMLLKQASQDAQQGVVQRSYVPDSQPPPEPHCNASKPSRRERNRQQEGEKQPFADPPPPASPSKKQRNEKDLSSAAHDVLVPRPPMVGYHQNGLPLAIAQPVSKGGKHIAGSPMLDLSANEGEPLDLSANEAPTAPAPSAAWGDEPVSKRPVRSQTEEEEEEPAFQRRPRAPPKQEQEDGDDDDGAGALPDNGPSQRPRELEVPIESPVGRSSATAHRVQETVELYSDDEDADKVASANRADTSDTRNLSPAMRMPAPVPLAAMISSDEEEDDDEPPPPIARKTEKKTMIGRRMSPDDAGDDDEEEEEEMAAARTARDEEYASGNWDSRESDDESGPYGRERSGFVEMPGHRDEPIGDLPVSHEAEYDLDAGPPPQEQPQPVMAAPGIAADTNFADDDWDDDDDDM